MKLNIGEKIKQLRKEKDITQEEFTSVTGVSHNFPDIDKEPRYMIQ